MMTETFQYDQLNRLTDIYFGDYHCKARYDNLGRMILKQGLVWKSVRPCVQTIFSTPQFNEEKIHAMNRAAAHPDRFSSNPLSIDYSSFDKVRLANEGDNELSFVYGFNEERIRMYESHGTWERQKTFVENCEFITESDVAGTTEKSWTFLTCPLGVFAVVEKQGEAETMHYILKDHQGNWTVIVDADGEVEQELSYDAWGNLRDPNAWTGETTTQLMFDRGFTGHEHLRSFGLINMNGRVYDPLMSSFLSVDAFVQSPDNSQSFNRYAYCTNNPLKYTDPSGWVMQGGMNPTNPFHDTWGQNFGEKVYTSTEVRQMLWSMGISVGTWMAGNEMQGGCSNSGDGGVRNEYSTPDDPPGKQKNNNAETIQNTTTEAGAVLTFIGNAAKLSDEATAGACAILQTAFDVCENITGISIVINAGINFYRYVNGDITFYSMCARDVMTIGEAAIATIPFGIGVLPSIALTAYDIEGGFEQTLYNDAWTKEFIKTNAARLNHFMTPKHGFQQTPIYYHHGK